MLLKKKIRRKKENERLPQPRTDSGYFSGGEEKKMAREANGNLLTCYEPENSRKSRYH